MNAILCMHAWFVCMHNIFRFWSDVSVSVCVLCELSMSRQSFWFVLSLSNRRYVKNVFLNSYFVAYAIVVVVINVVLTVCTVTVFDIVFFVHFKCYYVSIAPYIRLSRFLYNILKLKLNIISHILFHLLLSFRFSRYKRGDTKVLRNI